MTRLRALAAIAVVAVAVGCTTGGADDPDPDHDRTASGGLAVSRSKLAPHHLGGSSELRTWIAACPKLLKVFGPDMDFVRDYKSRCDGGKVVVRVWVPPSTARYSGDGDGRADAQDFWNKGYAGVRALSGSDKALIDYLESANEYDNFPPYKRSEYYRDFQQRFVELASAEGFKPLVGNIAVGNPDGDTSECDPAKAPVGSAIEKIRTMVPAFQAAAAAGGGWSYHGYAIELSKSADSGSNRDFAFRYRRFLECIPELRSIPLVLSEGGLDEAGDPDKSGWQARTDAATYVDWLKWYDAELQKDASVVGVTLFAIGGDGWKSFQLGPLVPQLVAIMDAAGRGTPAPPPPPPPDPAPIGVGGGAIGECWSRNGGVTNAGTPFDNGGGAAVHRWGPGDVQDFHDGALGPNLCMLRDGAGTAWMVRGAIRDLYFATGGGEGSLGYPLEDEQAGPQQRFEHGAIAWKDGRFQVVSGDDPPPPPPPSPTCPCLGDGKDNFCQYGASYPGCSMTSGGGYCDPNGDGDFSDADWTRGWYAYRDQCG